MLSLSGGARNHGVFPIPPSVRLHPGAPPTSPPPTHPQALIPAYHLVSSFPQPDRFSAGCPPPSVQVSDPLAPPGGHTGNTRELHPQGARRCPGCSTCTRQGILRTDPWEKDYHSCVTEVETGSEKLLSFSAPPARGRTPIGGHEFEQASGAGDGQGGLVC